MGSNTTWRNQSTIGIEHKKEKEGKPSYFYSLKNMDKSLPATDFWLFSYDLMSGSSVYVWRASVVALIGQSAVPWHVTRPRYNARDGNRCIHEKYKGWNSSTIVFSCWADLAQPSAQKTCADMIKSASGDGFNQFLLDIPSLWYIICICRCSVQKGPNVSTTPVMAMGCRQCLPLSVVQLKDKHCRKPHCRNGVVDTFGLWLLVKQKHWPLLENLQWTNRQIPNIFEVVRIMLNFSWN